MAVLVASDHGVALDLGLWTGFGLRRRFGRGRLPDAAKLGGGLAAGGFVHFLIAIEAIKLVGEVGGWCFPMFPMEGAFEFEALLDIPGSMENTVEVEGLEECPRPEVGQELLFEAVEFLLLGGLDVD